VYVVYSELGKLSSLVIISDVVFDEVTQLGACVKADFFHPQLCVSLKLPPSRLTSVS